MGIAAEAKQLVRRAINLNTCEVWCPFYEENVIVYDQCIADLKAGRDACPFKEGIGKMGAVVCSYSEEDAAVIE